MPNVILTAKAENAEAWEKNFRAQGKLFKRMTVSAPNQYRVTRNGEIAILMQVDDIDKFMEILDSPSMEKAMERGGDVVGSVRTYVLDKELNFQAQLGTRSSVHQLEVVGNTSSSRRARV